VTYPPVILPTLEALYQLGANICAEIENFHPNVVLGLAHSGWMPIVVAQAMWAETKEAPFPPSTRTNIGLEKKEIYDARYGKSPPAFCCGECCDGPGRKSHYLAWVSEQDAWLKTLRRQIKAVYPSTPKRILVVDDTFGGYRSGYAVLALLETLYPEAETYVRAGHNDLTDTFVTGWLEQFVPLLAKDILTTYRSRYGSPWHEQLKPLINGTEDITADRLDWRLINRDSPAVKALADHISADIALSAPEWAKTTACTYAIRRLKDEIENGAIVAPEEDRGHLFTITHLSLTHQERLATRAWRQGGVTRADIVQIYGGGPDEIKRGIRDVSVNHEWKICETTRDTLYFPIDSFESWINVYHTPVHGKPDIPMQGFAEFLPGGVWAGVYPISDNGNEAELFKDLLSTGVNSVIDLTNPKDPHRKFSYRNALLHRSREIGRTVEVKSFPLPFRASPERSQVHQILKYVTHSLEKRQRIFIHAAYNLEGRTPLILACLLIERGYSAKEALAKVNAFWVKTLCFLIRMPLSKEQERFILNWQRHH
jgi:hypothetical protein